MADELGWKVYIPAFQYCTDNAGMIAIGIPEIPKRRFYRARSFAAGKNGVLRKFKGFLIV
jgi:tRNA A37 threonylcarbamoyltransferase TsaD